MVLLFHAMLNYSFLQLSMYQKYPGLEIYGVYIKPLFCFFGFGVSLLLDSKVSLFLTIQKTLFIINVFLGSVCIPI